jgi:hypothetical protein
VLPIPEEVADRKVLVKRLVLGQEADVRQTASAGIVWGLPKRPHRSRRRTEQPSSQLEESRLSSAIWSN